MSALRQNMVGAVALSLTIAGSSEAEGLQLSWSRAAPPQGEHAPSLAPFRNGEALRFSSADATWIDLRKGDKDCLQIKGALTVSAVVQLAGAPTKKVPFVSKWHCRPNGRSYELGVMPDRSVFFSVSGSGAFDDQAREITTDERLKVGVPYVVSAVFTPGRRLAVYINGQLSGSLGDRIPGQLFLSETSVLIGTRPGAERSLGFDGLIADVRIEPTALPVAQVATLAKDLGLTDPPESQYDDARPLPPCRAITQGPKYHWFGYYDKAQFDPTGRYVLGMEVGFTGRSPAPDDEIKLGMVDLQDHDKWIALGSTHAWCWQQGCMLQWRPGSDCEVLWNDREGDRFVCRILNVKTGAMRTIPHPVYTLSPDGKTACAPDFRRIQDMRPGYGYCGLPDPYRDVLAPKESGIVRIDLGTGKTELIVSLARVAAIPHEHGDIRQMKHYFNHLLINTDGTRLEFLNRWRGEGQQGFGTRMMTCNLDGSDLYVLDPHGRTSHFIWRDPEHILAWSWHPDLGNGFIMYTDKTRNVEIVGKGVMDQNGHNTYLPDRDWILNDTYPDSRGRQHPYLYHVPTGQRFWLGHFKVGTGYGGEWRCDTHPRFSPDGRTVVIDSSHGPDGRQMYLIDISGIVAHAPKR